MTAASPETPELASTTPRKRPLPASSAADASQDSNNIVVVVRIRPLLALEAGSQRCLDVLHASSTSTCLRLGGSAGPRFTFDQVHDSHATQGQIFEQACRPLVESCVEGYNATVLAYGQTGSGKTYTMLGTMTDGSAMLQQQAGVIPRALEMLFEALQQRQGEDSEFRVRLQFLELYGEEIRDLLASKSFTSNKSDRLTIRDLGGSGEPEVVGATLQDVEATAEALACLEVGMLRRVTGATAMNESSSRSHAILSVVVEQTTKTQSIDDDNAEGLLQIKRSRFNFVDLAGSERQKKTQAEGKRLKEGIDINKGLLVLGNVISALGDPQKRGKAFVPYRDSKLTRLLKGSLGGNHKTLMIACVSPSENNMDESLNCLRYANRAKNIQNNAVVNLDSNSKLVAELKGQVQALARALLHSMEGTTPDRSEGEPVLFTRDVLQDLANSPSNSIVPSPFVQRSSALTSPMVQSSDAHSAEVIRKLREMEVEVRKTREELRQSQNSHDVAEEQLYAVKAERELYQLQLSVLSEDKGDAAGVAASDGTERAFLMKAAEYEKENGKLREALLRAEAKLAEASWLRSDSIPTDEDETNVALEKAQRELNEGRNRINLLRTALEADNDVEREAEQCTEDINDDDGEDISVLTKKYIAASIDDDRDDSSAVGDASSNHEDLSLELTKSQHRQQSDLLELSRNIAAKEELIDQLKLSQEKYAVSDEGQ